MRLSGEQRAAIRERVEAQHRGPWKVTRSWEHDYAIEITDDGDVPIMLIYSTGNDEVDDQDKARAQFIAAARTDVPLLLDALEEAEREAEREVERLRAMIEATRL